MTTYQGMDKWGITDFSHYIERVKNAYVALFFPGKYNVTIHVELLKKLYPFALFLFVFLIIWEFMHLVKKHSCNSLIFFYSILIIIFPLFINFHYILSELSNIHGLMIYSQIFVYVAIVNFMQQIINDYRLIDSFTNIIYVTVVIVLGAFAFLSLRIDNILYLKAYQINSIDISYCTAIASKLISTDGYSEDKAVCFYKWKDHNPEYLHYNGEFDIINYLPFYDQILAPDWIYFYINHCGYRPKTINEEDLDSNTLAKIEEMPIYPEDGSIEAIDDIVVIKFAE